MDIKKEAELKDEFEAWLNTKQSPDGRVTLYGRYLRRSEPMFFDSSFELWKQIPVDKRNSGNSFEVKKEAVQVKVLEVKNV